MKVNCPNLENRNRKYQGKSLSNFSSTKAFIRTLFQPYTSPYVLMLIFVVLKDFFLLQLHQKFHLSKRPVINVDTEIDKKIPFSPEHVKTYISFIDYFIKPADMLEKRMGYKYASQYVCLYLKFLSTLYKNSASIYRHCMTTTTRPKYLKTQRFRAIHFFDPHLLCVPSLHVAISAGVYAWFRQFFQLNILPQEDAQMYLAEIKAHAISIVESVLFVKQHSVNCIPLALYMLTSTMNKSFFSIEDAIEFIESLFLNSTEISPENRKEIIDYFIYMYDRALLESKYSANWQSCILHWLSDFAKNTGQNINLRTE